MVGHVIYFLLLGTTRVNSCLKARADGWSKQHLDSCLLPLAHVTSSTTPQSKCWQANTQCSLKEQFRDGLLILSLEKGEDVNLS